jgi:hypothetical protein
MPRPSTAAQKARAELEERKQRHAENLKLNSLAKFPATKEEWQKRITGPLAEHRRRMEAEREVGMKLSKERTDKHDIHPLAFKTAEALLAFSGDYRVHIMQQVQGYLIHESAALPLDIFRTMPKFGEGAVDEGPVFDKTKTGKAVGRVPVQAGTDDKAERDVPHNGAAGAPGLSPEDATRAFEAANETAAAKGRKPAPPTEEEVAAKKAEIAAQRADDIVSFEQGSPEAEAPPPAPPAPSEATNVVQLKQHTGKAKGKAGAKKSAAKKPSKAEQQKKAEEYVADQEKRIGPAPKSPAPAAPPPAPEQAQEEPDELGIPDFVKRPTMAGKNMAFDPSLEIH